MTSAPERGSPEWPKWRTCTRKVRYEEKPKGTAVMTSYRCPHCGGYHRTTRKRKLAPATKVAPARMVLRGGFLVEK